MTPQQLEQLLVALNRVADKMGNYTITGAADWPILAALCGVIIAMIGYMWHDLKGILKADRASWQGAVSDIKIELSNTRRDCFDYAEKEDSKIWAAMRDCQADCCRKDRR